MNKSLYKIKPRFNVGDWVIFTTSGNLYQVEKKENCEYTLKDIHGGSFCVSFSNEELVREWTIQDAKDGDVIFYDEGWTCIFKCIHGIWYSSYCFITNDGEFHTGYERHSVDSTIHGNAHPATKEQRDALMKEMNDAGYEWDAEKKKLNKKSKFDPKTLQPFDRVLARDYDTCKWKVDFYSHKEEDNRFPYICMGNNLYKQCIPYNDDTKYLVGTNKEAPEYYRYWED